MPTLCHRKQSAADCRYPGDFAWRFCCERDGDGGPRKWRSPAEGERPTHIFLVEPSGLKAHMPIAPEPKGWDWDGDLDRPTLNPSIDTSDGVKGWHGWLRAGVLTES